MSHRRYQDPKFPVFRQPLPRGLILPPSVRTPRVALGYVYGTLGGAFVDSLMRIERYELAKPAPLLWHLLRQSSVYVHRNRNRIATRFFEDTEADWLLQIDTDIEFPQTLVETLLQLAGSEKRVLAASVPLGPPFESSCWKRDRYPGVYACLPPSAIGYEPVECDAVASAVLLVHREVFAAIADREGQRWFAMRDHEDLADPKSLAAWTGQGPMRDRKWILQGEDLSFSERVGEAGFKVWCVKVPGLRHYKTLPLSHDFESAEDFSVAQGNAPETEGAFMPVEQPPAEQNP